jgi:hypothetical protein
MDGEPRRSGRLGRTKPQAGQEFRRADVNLRILDSDNLAASGGGTGQACQRLLQRAFVAA